MGVLRRELSTCRVYATSVANELDEVARELLGDRTDVVLSVGGDGTAVGLVNALARASRRAKHPMPAIGLCRMGTGNGWARAMHVPKFAEALRIAARAERVGLLPPTRPSDLIEVEGTLTHFAGTGWDADLIADFHAQKTEKGIVPPRFRNGLVGYLRGLFTRTVPRHLQKARAEVEIINLGEPALTVDEHGRPTACPGGEAGGLLYRGPTSVCAVGTTEEWGFGFRAFPFARIVDGRMNVRNYGATAAEAVMRIPSLWRGAHPTPKMDSWLVTRCLMRYSEPLPFQLGGDLLGYRDEVEYRVAEEKVHLVDFQRWMRGDGTLEATRKRPSEREASAFTSPA